MLSLTAHPLWRRWFGSRSEKAASRFLRSLGYRLIEHNFTCDIGEIDIIALDGKTLVFVEVRSTESGDAQSAAQSVDSRKQSRLTRLALYYTQKRRLLDRAARFDVLAISWPAGQPQPTITHYPNAFDAVGRFQMHS